MHLAAVVVVEGHRVSPMGVESDGAAILRGEVFHALAIVIYNIAVWRRFPPGEGVAGAGEGVGGEVLRGIVGEGLVGHGARAAVGVKYYRVCIGDQGSFHTVQIHMIACYIREEVARRVFSLHIGAPPAGEDARVVHCHTDGRVS